MLIVPDNRSFRNIWCMQTKNRISQDAQFASVQYNECTHPQRRRISGRNISCELPSADRQMKKEVVYNEKYPPEFFDVV